jgi:hypothetical protein
MYRLALRNPRSTIRRLCAPTPEGPFFTAPTKVSAPAPTSSDWQDKGTYFGHHQIAMPPGVPDWFVNPFNGERVVDPQRPWWTILDFNPELGDIKTVWEASRMDWAVIFAQRTAAGDTASFARLDTWISNWISINRPYTGPNWKCGQEASIRVMHLALAALLLGGPSHAGPGLAPLVALHLKRIAPTTSYARAQDNNHGTSEAAALFIGGSWLALLGDKRGAGWAEAGRRMLEERVLALVETDGSFSQYSTNYHRLMLDTVSLAEVWRQRVSLSDFTSAFRERAVAATGWLRAMVSEQTGDAANLGANDGARLLPLGPSPYRDFRPSVQLAGALFSGERAYAGEGDWNHYAQWLGVDLPDRVAAPIRSQLLNKGGYGLLVAGDAKAILRYPRYRFRPSHADALHLDLWTGDHALLRDGGTFTYNAPNEVLDRFSGTEGHNTIQFDGRNQMPRIGRFLFADWLRAESVTLDGQTGTMAAAYRDNKGVRHARRVQITQRSQLDVLDIISGPFTIACLRWRLAPADWQITADGARSTLGVLRITGDMPLNLRLVEGIESRHYLAQTPVAVLEATFSKAGTIATKVSWTQ